VGLKDKLYVIGGFVEGWTPTDDVHEYDPASDRWQQLAALPTPRGALAAAVLDGKIHAVGGVGWRGRNTPAHEVYDPATNRWTALAYVPTARDHLAVAAMDGRLYDTTCNHLGTVAVFVIMMTVAHAEPRPVPKPQGPGGSCPHGYISSGSFCAPSQGAQDAIPKPSNGTCPGGWTSSGSFCLRSGSGR
jgi:N-acetylneuraminic acid mutarotase